MRFKKITVLAVLSALSAVLLFSGCGNRNAEQGKVSSASGTAAASAENEADNDTLTLSARCYNADQTALAGGTIEVLNGSISLTSVITDENGKFADVIIPSATRLTFIIKNAQGEEIASGDITFDLSSEHEAISIVPYSDTEEETGKNETIELPSGKTNLLGVLYVDGKKRPSFASLTLNRGDSATPVPQAPAKEPAAPAADTSEKTSAEKSE